MAEYDDIVVGGGSEPVLVYTDPFDHYAVGAGGLSALDLAQEAAERGISVVYSSRQNPQPAGARVSGR